MNNIIAVFVGGGLGSVLRYAMTLWIPVTGQSYFPWATFLSNIAASFVLGLLIGLGIKSSLDNRIPLLLIVGFCGGFSTFSTFSNEVFVLLERGDYAQSICYALSSMVTCVVAVGIGFMLTTK